DNNRANNEKDVFKVCEKDSDGKEIDESERKDMKVDSISTGERCVTVTSPDQLKKAFEKHFNDTRDFRKRQFYRKEI
ncbi:470_t:CDS:1, partial [Gigaspora margarita]